MREEQLQQVGLSEKEAKVYIVSLELGPGTAQELAQKTGLRRPTVYFTIELLKKRGLMSSFEKGKKTYFTAESPENLRLLIEKQEKFAQISRQTLSALLGDLTPLFDATGERPRVRFFEGKEGLMAMQEDFLRTKEKEIEEFFSDDDIRAVFTSQELEKYKERKIQKKIASRAVYTRRSGAVQKAAPYSELRWVSPEQFLFSSDIIIYGDKVGIASLRGKLIGVIVESKEMAETMRAIFELAWKAAQ